MYSGNVSTEKDLKNFLRDLFGYTNPETIYIELRFLGNAVKTKYIRYDDIDDFVESLFSKKYRKILDEYNIYFGVLPRENFFPDELDENAYPKVSGRKKHVIRGRWLWADNDYKKQIREPPDMCIDDLERSGYCVLEDDPVNGRLHVILRVGDKLVEIDKPSYDEIIDLVKRLDETFGIKITYVVDSGYGYHFYTKLTEELSADKIQEIEEMYARIGNDESVKDIARIMRLPYTYNNKYKMYNLIRQSKIIYHNDVAMDPETIKERLKKALETVNKQTKHEEEAKQKEPAVKKRRSLTPIEIRKIVDILKPIWIPGHRDLIEFYFLGMLWWKGIDKDTARQIIDAIAKETNDEEHEQRMRLVDYLWDRMEQQIPDRIAGRNHLIDEITNAIIDLKHVNDEDARDEAIKIVESIEDIIKKHTKSILMRVPYETSTWFVNDPKRGIVLLKETVRERNGEPEVVRRRKYIMQWYIYKVLVVKTQTKYYYKIGFKNARTKEKMILSGTLDEIVNMMRVHGVQRKNLVYDAVSSIISEFIRRKIARVKHTSEACGIYLHKDRLVLVKNAVLSSLITPKEIITEENMRDAIDKLKKIREHYNHYKFDVSILWTAYSIISYVLKRHYNVKQYYLFLHGEKQTGKSTLARIITTMFPIKLANLDEIPIEGGSEYRLAYKLNVSTFPILEDEIENISVRPGLISLLKRASTGVAVRWRGDTRTIYKARSPIIFTSNRREIFSDSALVERLILLEFDHNDYVYNKPKEKLDEFKKVLNEYLEKAPALGYLLIQTVIEYWDNIKTKFVHRLHTKEDVIELGKYIWEIISRKLGIDIPWCREIRLEEDKIEEREREIFFEIIEDIVRDTIIRSKFNIDEYRDVTLSYILTVLYRKMLLPSWIHVISRSGVVVISATIIDVIRRKYGYTPIGGLKQLAQRLGYDYGVKKPRGKIVKGMIVPLSEFDYPIDADIYTEPNEKRNYQEDITYNNIELSDVEIDLARDIDNMLFERDKKITEDNVLSALLELGMPYSDDTKKLAKRIYLYLKYKYSAGKP